MPQILEYDYYEATLAITIATTRPEAAPSGIFTAASLHEEYAAKVRSLLREYRSPLDSYLPHYRVERIMPSGSARDIDGNYDLFRQQFSLGVALLQSAWTADAGTWMALEHNIEKATRDLLRANSVPDVFIPGEAGVIGESYIDIIVTLGAATNRGLWQVPT